jgi:pimeloyl-ACP methyl ester carboxylesterase
MIKQIQIEGSKIIYHVYGKGKQVVLVHGFGETGDVWKNQVSFLEKEFELIIPDLPGSGQSDLVNDMSIEGMAEVIKIILDTERDPDKITKFLPSESSKVLPSGGGRAVLIGHSMGGYITLAFAEKYPDYLSAFGLFHSTAFADSEEKIETRKKGIEFVKKHGAFEFLKNATPNLFSPSSREEKPELIGGFIDGLRNFSSEAVVLYYEAMIQRPERTQLLKTTHLPVLFILGKYDNAIPLNDTLKLAHMPEKAYIHILYYSGHMGMLEEDDNSNHILKKFLSEI